MWNGDWGKVFRAIQLVLPTVGRRAEVWVGDGAFVKATLGRDRMEVISIEHLLLFSCQRLYDCSSHSHLEWKLQEGEIWIFFPLFTKESQPWEQCRAHSGPSATTC